MTNHMRRARRRPDDDRMFDWVECTVDVDYGDGAGIVSRTMPAPFFAVQWMLEHLRDGPVEITGGGVVHRLEIVT